MMAQLASGADVEVECETVSLRCPITGLRIGTPVKFSACTHRQCFDVDSWSSLIELSEVIKCPVCSRAYSSSDGLINDWNFGSILRQTPDTFTWLEGLE
ncbi:SUMO ligase siz1 [Ceratobasidium sp. 428]|nr:SUMO ligase siz1 [Ceratobasidium sp. 428]